MSIELKNNHYEKFKKCRSSILNAGPSLRYMYGCKALEEEWKKFENYQISPYSQEYEPNIYYYQYDIELYIFLHFEDLLKRELELTTDPKRIKLLCELGPTQLKKEEHLANAASIRWPARYAPDGSYMGDLAITPWLMDYFYGIANYKNVIEFGGAGQGKTYGPLAFMCMIYDFFIFTKHGAQCTFSTVSESKLQGSTWPYLNQLYNIGHRHPFSLSAGKAIKSSDYTYKRIELGGKGKRLEEGGTLKGVLLPKGRKDSTVVDKLTGFHSPVARIYLLDEGQSTDDAPLSAYTNMYLHPRWGWFNMSGNYDLPNDLLGINTEPTTGWDSVNERTHMWESVLKKKNESLDQKSLVIHFNNDISPGVLDPEFGKKYKRFVPTVEKREKLYPTDESKKTLAYKRFWTGFKFEKNLDEKKPVLTLDLIEDNKCSENLPDDFVEFYVMGSFDSAPASIDRNINTTFGVGMCNDGLPMIYCKQIELYPKPTKAMEYYRQTCERIIKTNQKFEIQRGHQIMDWTARPAHIEMLAGMGWPCHHLIYQESVPYKLGRNKITGAHEDKIQLESIESFINSNFIKNVKYYAHETVANKITLGAYIFRLFVEHGRIRKLNSGILTGLNANTFEKEFLTREFLKLKRDGGEILTLAKKEDFKSDHGFSPDILDTFFQFFYMLFVIYKVHPNKKGLGLLKREDQIKKSNVKQKKLWNNKLSYNV